MNHDATAERTADSTPPPSDSAPPTSGRVPRSEGNEILWSYDRIHSALAKIYRPHHDEDLRHLLRALSRLPEKRRLTFRGGGQSIDAQGLNDYVVIQLDTEEMHRIGEPQRDALGAYYVTIG